MKALSYARRDRRAKKRESAVCGLPVSMLQPVLTA